MTRRVPWLSLLLALGLVRLWLMPMFSSFWVDEMGTVFVVRQGGTHPSFAVAPQVPQSIYYVLPRAAQAVLGYSEFAYRLPSGLAMMAALALIARLAARLIRPEAAWFAVFACLALGGFDYQASDARPYALGTLIAAAAFLFLVRWMDSGRWRDAAGFLVPAALLWRVQLVFWPMYLAFAVYTAVRLLWWGGPPGPRTGPLAGPPAEGRRYLHTIAVFAALALALVPTALDAMRLFRQAGAHVVVAQPNLLALLNSLKLGLVLVCGAGAWLWSRLQPAEWERPKIGPASLVLVLGWWLAQPLGLFAFSWLTGSSIFVSRYLFLSLPGCALAATAVAAHFIPAKRWNLAAAALGIGLLAMNGQWSRWWPPHHNSDWRSAAAAVRAHAAADTPVICASPFIEARPPVWTPEYRLPGFLYAQLYVYPVPGRIYLFPFEPSPEAYRFAGSLVRGALPATGRFLVYGGAGQAGYWRDWFAKQPELADWHVARLGPFRDVEVYRFNK
jgi:hypothetical protein